MKEDLSYPSHQNKKGNVVDDCDEVEVQNIQLVESHVPLVKSPSDTKIYTPALHKLNNEDISLIEKISNFVESIRLDSRKEMNSRRDSTPNRSACGGDIRYVEQVDKTQQSPLPHCSSSMSPSWAEASRLTSKRDDRDNSQNRATEQLLLQAEKFKARVEAPKGNYSNYSSLLMPYD